MPPKQSKAVAVAAAPPVDIPLAHITPPDVAEKVQQWLAQLSEKDLALQRHAAAYLGTSYFPEKTHGFKKWLAAQTPAAQKSK